MRYFMMFMLALLACGNPADIGAPTVPDGSWSGQDGRNEYAALAVSGGSIGGLTWESRLDDTSWQRFVAPPMPLRPFFAFDTLSAYGNTVHIEGEYNADADTWEGWHRVDEQAIVDFVLEREQ